jgi:hypothetical protein
LGLDVIRHDQRVGRDLDSTGVDERGKVGCDHISRHADDSGDRPRGIV